MPAGSKTLYLTFDDGPVYGPTEFVLETLRDFKAKATFFCIGDNIIKHPKVFQQIIDEGHGIGNHTYNHLNGSNTSLSVYLQNIQECQFIIEGKRKDGKSGNMYPLFRPPYGRISRDQRQALSDYHIIMWDELRLDFDKNLSSKQLLQSTISATRDGSIIVFHDSLKAEKHLHTVLPRFMAHFASLGYTFRSITV
ncbi:MAG: polysaccharide deacetylase family protein [Cyclobacteriaceae bacterium]|nr:polysaccharide deacetylase family protein [Cyclobacteriaceae bacterium]